MRRRTVTLYRLYADSGDLLYVGIAGNPGRRLQDHAHDKSWWDRVATIRCVHFPSRREAEQAECDAIITEQPRYNVTWNDARLAEARERAASVPTRWLYPPEEVAALLDVEPADVWRLIHSGELPAVRIGRQVRVRAEAVAERQAVS